MCSDVRSWSKIPPQLFILLHYQWGHLTYPVPRTLERTGQTELFGGQDVKSKCPLAFCSLKNCEKNCTMIHLSLWCSICSCFLWVEMLLFPVTLRSHQTVNITTIVWCPHTSLSHLRRHPGSPGCCYLTHLLGVTELGSWIYFEGWCSLCHRCTRWTAPVRNLSRAKAKAVHFQTLKSHFLQK